METTKDSQAFGWRMKAWVGFLFVVHLPIWGWFVSNI
jgi:hypothetical protein